MTSTGDDGAEILHELKNVSMKMQQLVERKKVLCIMQELTKRVCYERTDEGEEEGNEQELHQIDNKLYQLEAIRAKLQLRHDRLADGQVEESSSSTPQIFFVEPHPNIPAPTVILDHAELQFVPDKTQCPGCQQFITTETSASVSSVTWLVCITTAMMGCVAGCCLIPFCLDKFKSITHKCPKCHTSIYTVKKL